jgi:hypothetical protein
MLGWLVPGTTLNTLTSTAGWFLQIMNDRYPLVTYPGFRIKIGFEDIFGEYRLVDASSCPPIDVPKLC